VSVSPNDCNLPVPPRGLSVAWGEVGLGWAFIMQGVSVDEAFLDLTGLPGTPAELASTLRRRILVRPLPSNTV
jgi:hypothetical protein